MVLPQALLCFTLLSLTNAIRTPNVPIGLYNLQKSTADNVMSSDGAQIVFAKPAFPFQEHYLTMPVDHLHNESRYEPHSNGTFALRYFYDDQFYEPGGPVFILDGGETSIEDRFLFLESGILNILSRATSGIGILLEHRYYGKSHVTQNLTTDSLRFLTTEQSLYDNYYFAEHVNLPRLGKLNPRKTPVIIYGGSYAGGKAAFSRLLFPDTFYGAIASSGVVHAQLDSWQYFEPIRLHGPQKCIQAVEKVSSQVDHLSANDTAFAQMQDAFGLDGLTHKDDFVNTISLPLSGWQGRIWTKSSRRNPFYTFCDALVPPEEVDEPMAATPILMKRYARYVRDHIATLCPYDNQDLCFGSHDAALYEDTSLDADFRLWTWQYCTVGVLLRKCDSLTEEHAIQEWGYFIGAAPKGQPSLVSRMVDVKYNQRVCQLAFRDGNYTTMPKSPELDRINKYGDFKLEAKCLAIVDGDEDPWIFATLHSPAAQSRQDSIHQPYKLIKGGVHHWDEYGSYRDESEPNEIAKIHSQEVEFVLEWLNEFHHHKESTSQIS